MSPPVSSTHLDVYKRQRVERAQALAQELTARWLKKYEGVMRICNYTVGQADADNTWARSTRAPIGNCN